VHMHALDIPIHHEQNTTTTKKKATTSRLAFPTMLLNPNAPLSSLPKRASLPLIPNTPPGSAWFWGPHDDLGRLNLLTPQRIASATHSCVKTGVVIPLNLPLNIPDPPFFGRAALTHKITSIGPGAFDDEISLNTQSSTQWDGFRHFADPASGLHYNGIKSEDILTGATGRLGIDAWARKGIVGRGVLLDVYTWAQKTGKAYDPFTCHAITAEDLHACATAQNITFEPGNILLVRTGWLATYTSLPPTQRTTQASLPLAQHTYAGLSASDSMKDFLHDTYFAAAATDSPMFEAWPPESWAGSLHASCLALWGMPIGELWDLEDLSAVRAACYELGVRQTLTLCRCVRRRAGGSFWW